MDLCLQRPREGGGVAVSDRGGALVFCGLGTDPFCHVDSGMF